eukprot:COSAG01_NODE_810_length_13426_cov_7.873790_2_plen_34_part_00
MSKFNAFAYLISKRVNFDKLARDGSDLGSHRRP